MKFKINDLGKLEIWRKSRYQLQLCPFTRDFNCSDSCPLFGEPKERELEIELSLCRNNIYCRIVDFVDERK